MLTSAPNLKSAAITVLEIWNAEKHGIKVFRIVEIVGTECGGSNKSFKCKYFGNYKDIWKDLYIMSLVLNIETIPKSENIGAQCEDQNMTMQIYRKL